MKVMFLGVGEACDERLANTSIWIVTKVKERRISVLLDCGFTVPSLYWQQTGDEEDLDAVWLSHFHGDHFFGIPALLLRMYEMGRKRPLTILGQTDVDKIVQQIMDLAYPNFISKLTYPLEFVPVKTDRSIDAVGLLWRFAENGHSERDLAVRISDDERSLFYSGDGLPTPQTESLARGCDLVVHEAFRLEQSNQGHGTVLQCIDFARRAKVPCLALVHMQRDERRERYQEVLGMLGTIDDIHVLFPEPGDQLEL
jgi:ribonuclease Z